MRYLEIDLCHACSGSAHINKECYDKCSKTLKDILAPLRAEMEGALRGLNIMEYQKRRIKELFDKFCEEGK